MSTPKPTRQPVLLVLHNDGFVEVFGEKQLVEARIVCVPAMSTQAGEILAEEYVESILTHRYRELYYPGNRIAAENWQRVTPVTIAKRNDELLLLRMIDQLKDELAKLRADVSQAVQA